jgi:glycine oxidase
MIGAFTGAKGVYVATGHYRNGILLAPLTARMIADAIEGKQSADHSGFGPNRFSN